MILGHCVQCNTNTQHAHTHHTDDTTSSTGILLFLGVMINKRRYRSGEDAGGQCLLVHPRQREGQESWWRLFIERIINSGALRETQRT